MERLDMARAFTYIEPGPVVLLTTFDGVKSNIMTLTWTMVLGFDASFAITTGPWNHSFDGLVKTRECVLAIPTADMIDTVIGIGMCSGSDTDKFDTFNLTALPAARVKAPLIGECLANIECRLVDRIDDHSILILQGVAAHHDRGRKERRLLHAIGDGTFVADGEAFDRKAAMRAKIPAGV